jgi:hypothetical protein
VCFLDVVQAYKGIQKEKEALEASLKALAEAKNSTDDGNSAENISGIDSSASLEGIKNGTEVFKNS